MKNLIFQIIMIAIVIISFFIGKSYERQKQTVDITTNANDSIAYKLEEIMQILNKNDSIKSVNDSIDIKVITVEKVYEKTINNIINNTPDDDYAFFSAYTERYCGYNYSDSIKNR